MRNYFSIIAVFLALSAFAQNFNQSFRGLEPIRYTATYLVLSQPDSTNPSTIRKEKMLLQIGDSISKFLSMALFMNDTITRKFSNHAQLQEYLMNPQRPIPGTLYQIYKNYPRGKISILERIPSSSYKYLEDLGKFEWNLTADTSTVCGYKAQKATCDYGGRSWTAWFSPEIPYNDGPYKFNGLPGLIVKVYDSRRHYVFELLSFIKPEKSLMIDMLDYEYIITTKQAFFRAQDSFRDDIVNRAKEAGGDNNMQQTAAKNMAMRNNPIELIRK